nr:unnamed protein product [Callosobruchus chinensis]
MKDRRVLHSACLYHKVVTMKVPLKLHDKITFRHYVHNANIRSKTTVTPPAHHTALFERSFSYNISKAYNAVPQSLKPKSLKTFTHQYIANYENYSVIPYYDFLSYFRTRLS